MYDEGEEFTDALNGVYDEGEEFTDGDGVFDFERVEILNSSNITTSFESSVGYGQEDKIFIFRLTVDSFSASDNDTVQVTVKAEENSPPLIEFQGLDNDEDNSINCGGSTDGSEDGFDCILLFLNDYISSISDPEGDSIISSAWYNENGEEISDVAFSVTFTSSEPHYLIYRAIDSYGDYMDAIITIYSSVQNTYPSITMMNSTYEVNEYNDIDGNGEWDENLDTGSSIQIEALISDEEHLVSDIEINWTISCVTDYCNEAEDFTDSNGNGVWDEDEDFIDCGLDGVCSDIIECSNPDIDNTEQNGVWDEAVFLTDENIDYSTGIASINFHPPEVQYNSDNVQFIITVTARDPFQQNPNNEDPPSIGNATIEIKNINQAPSIESYDFDSAIEDANFSLNNDIDGDGNLLDSFTICDTDNSLDDISLIVLNGNDYEVVSQSSNIIMPTTESNEDVEISVELLFSDGEGNNNTANYNILLNVTPFDDIPEIIGIASNQDFFEDESFLLMAENILINDPDDESWDIILYEDDNEPYSLDGNLVIPFPNYFGDITIPLQASDGNSQSDIYNLFIDLIPVNDPPTSIWTEQGIAEFKYFLDEDFNDSTLFNFDTIFSDIDNEELIFNYPSDEVFESFDMQLNMSNDITLYSTFNVHSNLDDQGVLESENFEISVTDGENSSNVYDFEVTVLPKNDPPIFYAGSEYVEMAIINGQQSSVTIDLTSDVSLTGQEISPYVFDIEDNPWTFEIVDCPDNGSLLIGEPFDDFGVDGCDDEYEDGNGGCLDNPNFGADGCDDEYEDGEGGCLDELSPVYISSDPNGDNIDYNGDNHDLFNNPEGKENNCIWDEGEDFADEDFSQNWDSFGTYFIYYPNPGFRCVDQIKIKAIDSGANYVESNSVGVMEPSNEESNIIIAEIFVDLCNFPPEIDSYNEASITQIELYEDSSLDISSVDLSYFVFSDEDGDDVISVHAIPWNDFGEDGIFDTGDEGEGNNQWDEGEGWNDCGDDGLCENDPNYPGPDNGEGDGQINEAITDNLHYSVISQCSNSQYESQFDCEYNDELWETTVVFQEDYNGTLSVAIQANDGQPAYNLSNPYIVDFYVQNINDSPVITNAYILSSENDTIDYVFEDDFGVEFKIDVEDIDSSEDLNDNPFNLEDLTWTFNSPNENVYASEHNPNQFFIDSLRGNWNGEEVLNIEVCDDSERYCNSYNFTVRALPVNDFPVNFSVEYSTLSSSFEDRTIYEDIFGFEEEGQNKIIEYSIFYEDVDCDLTLNNFHFDPENQSTTPEPFNPLIFIPDTLDWETDYQGFNIEDYELLEYIDIENNCNNSIQYYKRIQFNALRENWNGFDQISMSIFPQGSDEILDVVSLPVEVLPLNDYPSAFSIYGDLLDYPMDPTTFYTPCELDNNPNCTEIIHGYEFSDEHNFFRLHNVLDSNGDVLIQESVDYTNFDIGKILFKWDRTEDVDLDNSVSEYYQPSLYYRLELVETGETYEDLNNNNQHDEGEECEDINLNGICDSPSDYTFVIAEIDDALFSQNDPCTAILGDNSLCSDDSFPWISGNEHGWAVLDIRETFFKYKEGFFDNPNSDSGEFGFYDTVDSTMGEYGYGHIDYFGTTEYKWKVTAYNRWWDYQSNNENEIVAESDAMRFFVDLERPEADFSIIQNPLFSEFYELYMITNEEVLISESSLYINDNTSLNVFPFNSSDNDSGRTTFLYYAGQFGADGPGIYEFDFYTLDELKNAGVSTYSVSYVYAVPEYFSSLPSPSQLVELVIPQYSLIHPSGIILSESSININDLDKISISNEITISSYDMQLQSPLKLRFSSNYFNDFDVEKIRIAKKNSLGQWDILDSQVSTEFIESNINEIGSYALFYIENIEDIIPDDFKLISCYPNPFNPNINIDFSVPYSTMVTMHIYDINGKKIKTLISGNLEPGFVSINWDGTNDAGSLISSGIYFVKLKVDNETAIKKITMMK